MSSARRREQAVRAEELVQRGRQVVLAVAVSPKYTPLHGMATHIITYDDLALLRLDERVVHRVNPDVRPGVRRFVKITISRHRFASEGNSHNHLFAYRWGMRIRGRDRNLDHAGEDTI